MSNFRFKIQLTAIHLLICVGIALVGWLIVFHIWHPSPLDKAVGITHIFLMMLAIDLILGPMLTFFVAKQGKKSLKFDLLIIALVQSSALIYGIYNITINRPVYIAFDTNGFDLVQASNIPKESLSKAQFPYHQLEYGKPKFVGVRPPISIAEKNQRLFVELETGVSPSMQPNLYVPINNVWNLINKSEQPIEQLYKKNERKRVEKVFQKYQTATGWLSMRAYNESKVVLINDKKREIIAIVDLKP